MFKNNKIERKKLLMLVVLSVGCVYLILACVKTVPHMEIKNITLLRVLRTKSTILPSSNPDDAPGHKILPLRNVNVLYKERHKPSCAARQKGQYKPMSKELPLTALASPWRSGNTWVRHLLQMATGIGTTSQYCDRQLQKHGFPYECARNNLSKYIVMKTHEPHTGRASLVKKPITHPFSRAVVIIRDPYTFIVANLGGGHLTIVPESKYYQPRFRNYTQPRFLRWWKHFNHFWLEEFEGQVYPVLYTKFIRDTGNELRKVLTFLGVDFTEGDIECVIGDLEGNFHRKARVWTNITNIKELYDTDMQRQIDDSIRDISDILMKKYHVAWVNDKYTVNG